MKITTSKQLRLLGWFFLLAAGALAFLWFYWFAPMRHLSDSEWCEAHNPRQIWAETQKQINRTGVDHDGSIEIGRFGDKAWTEWLIRRNKSIFEAANKASHDDRWPFHLDTALWNITNQRMT